MNTKNHYDLESTTTPRGIQAWKLYNSEHAMVTFLRFEPGESLAPHETPVDVYFYVVEGTGVVLVGDEKKEVTKGTLVESPKNITHCWYNESDAPLIVMVNKVPRPGNL